MTYSLGHTFEPWDINGDDIVKRFEGTGDCLICSFEESVFRDSQKANMALVKAAPALYRALARWAEFAKNNGYTDADFKTGETGWITETEEALAIARDY